MTTATVINTV